MLILMVDDDRFSIRLRKMIIERCGHQTVAAGDLSEALACLAGSNVDVVLMDLRLPELAEGLALLRAIHETAPQVRVVVLSGYTPDLSGRPEREFASAVLSKPVRTERLLEALGIRPPGGELLQGQTG